jgi:thioesterase domain-containing protein/acyl carrier protein
MLWFSTLPETPERGKMKQGPRDKAGQKLAEGRAVEQNPAATRELLELQLVQLWEKVLGIKPIHGKDDFFSLGGNSLNAVHLFVEIEQRFGIALPVVSLLDSPTPESLAAVIQEAQWTPASCLVPIRYGAGKPPFFVVPAHSGHLKLLRKLEQYLDPEQPLYGFQARGIDGREGPHTSLDEMARQYIKEMRAIQPQGPYLLSGHCFGAMVVFEMAQQLRAEGERIGLLVLLDAMPFPGLYRRNFRYYLRRTIYHLKRRPRLLPSYIGDHLRQRRIGAGIKPFGRGLQSKVLGSLERVERSAFIAACSYKPQRYPGDIVCVWSDELAHVSEFQSAWATLCEKVIESYVVPGTQLTLFDEPNVGTLAAYLKACLDQPQVNARP